MALALLLLSFCNLVNWLSLVLFNYSYANELHIFSPFPMRSKYRSRDHCYIWKLFASFDNAFWMSFLLFNKKAKALTNNPKYKILTKHSKLLSSLCHIRTIFQPKSKKHLLKSFMKWTQYCFSVFRSSSQVMKFEVTMSEDATIFFGSLHTLLSLLNFANLVTEIKYIADTSVSVDILLSIY